MAAKIKEPPTFNPEEGDNYENWKRDIKVWQILNDERYKKQYGASVYLALKGTAREAVRSMDIKDLEKDTGVDEVIKVLDAIFLKDTATQAYCAFRDYVTYVEHSRPKCIVL